jgi:hypothetical protein
MRKKKGTKEFKKVGLSPEIRITGVPADIHSQLHNIAKNEGHNNLSAILRPHLRKIVESYPEKMRNPPRED